MSRFQLSPRKRALLETWRREEGLSAVRPQAITRRESVEPAPLSSSQQRIWILSTLDPGSSFYNLPLALNLQGVLNRSALAHGLSVVVGRHEALRTTFEIVDGEPRQKVSPHAGSTPLPLIDLAALPASVRTGECRRVLDAEARRPFDLVHGPLLRALLLRQEPDRHALLLSAHHTILDGWSQGLLLQELSAVYRSHGTGVPPALQPLSIQYADYADWESRRWQAGELRDQMDYWLRRLEASLPVLALPLDRPRPKVQTFRGAYRRFAGDRRVSQALRALGRQQRVTPFAILLTAYAIWLHRHTSQTDLLIGIPSANRGRPELQQIIGCFPSTLVMRCDLAGDPPFRELLERIQSNLVEAFAHQEIGFDKLVKELHLERDASRNPIFQAAFVLHTLQEAELDLPGLEVEPLPVNSGQAKFDLTLEMYQTPTEFVGHLEYNPDLHFDSTAALFTERFLTLLQGIVNEPERRLADLPLLSPSELHVLRVERNATSAAYPHDRCVHELFEEQAAASPDALAVSEPGRCLTYGELERRANHLAWRLRRLGVGPDVPVGIATDPSLEMIVAALAVLKAGGAYLPLDPSYPEERLRVMLEDSGAAALLTQEHLVARVSRTRVPRLLLDGPESHQGTTERPPGPRSPRHLAYVIYTSGSTGEPKGIQVEHRSVVNYITFHRRRFAVGPGDRSGKTASFSFDSSVGEIWPSLTSGGSVHIAGDEERQQPERLRDWLVAEGIKVHLLVTPLAEAVLRLPWPEPTALRSLLVGGDWMRQAHRPGIPFEVYNCFGPTETTVLATAGLVPAGSAEPPSLGYPVDNVRLYLLGSHGELVPQGAAGEIFVGGDCLARGYGGRPDLTAERFVPDPFGGQPGARLYRTGDRARHRTDGSLEFLGRTDHQVKVRGFRIELGDVEAALSRHPGVAASAVTVFEPRPGDRRLTAYVVPAREANPTRAELRNALSGQLPSYMVPAAFVLLDALPLTPTGKVNRRLLPLPDPTRPDLAVPYAAPRTAVERHLIEIWSAVLGIEGIGIHDNFFELGGDSILAIRISARGHEIGLGLPPLSLFRCPTVSELAALTEPASTLRTEQEAVTDAVTLTPIQRWFFEQDFAEPWHFNQAALLVVRHRVSPRALERALAGLLERHDALRLRFARRGDTWEPTGGAPGEPVSFSHADLSALGVHQQAATVTAAAAGLQTGLDLTAGPLLRAAWFDLGPDRDGRLLIVIHHLVVDTVSWSILLEDLETALRIEGGSRNLRLAAKTTSWRDWSTRLEAYAATPAALQELGFWLAEGARPVVPVPVDRGGSGVPTSTRTLSVSLTAEETQALLQQVPRAYRNRVDDVLLTALLLVFEEWCGEGSGLRIDLEAHGREPLFADVDLSRTVGWFTALYPVTLCRDGATGPGELLKAVKERLRSVPLHGLGFGVLRYLCADESVARSLRELPPATVSFNYLGRIDSPLSRESLLAPAPEPVGPYRSPRNRRVHAFEILAMVFAGELRVDWTYSPELHDDARIQWICAGFTAALRTLIAHCLEVEPGGATPSDFPLARVDQGTLDRLLRSEPAIVDLLPLSPMQLDMLIHAVAVAHSDLGVLQFLWRLQGPLDGETLRASWQRAMERHGMLRTAFLWRDLREPLQAVCRAPRLPWETLDWSALPEARRPTALEALCLEDRRRGLALDRPPLMRLTLVRTGEREHHLLWTVHHLLLDGWGHARLVAEVFRLYEALAAGEEPQLPPARSYRDFIAWLQRQDEREAETFWRQALEGFGAPTPLPLDGVHRDPTATGFGEARLLLSPELSAALRDRARSDRLTLGTLVQGAWALCLARSSGEEEAIFGITVSGRPPDLPGVEAILGPFLNNVPLRVPVRLDAELIPWLRELLDRQVRQRSYEYLSQARIRAGSEVPAHLPLYESMVVFENYPVESDASGPRSLVTEQVYHFGSRTSSALTLLAEPAPALPLSLAYDCRRFDAATAQRILGRVRSLLEGMTGPPETRLGELPLLDAQERSQLCASEVSSPAAADEELEAALRQRPDVRDVAVVSRGTALVAYVVSSGQARPSAAVLRSWLRERVDGRRLPTDFVFLDALPRDAAGELAAGSLPDPDAVHGEARRGSLQRDLAGVDVLEIQLAALWETVFGLRPIAATDDFFELGGTSVLAIALMTRIREQFGHDLPLSVLLSATTPRELAARLRERKDLAAWSPLVAIKPGGSRRPFFCVHPAGGNVLSFADLARHFDPERPFYALQAVGLDGTREPLTSVEDMAACYLDEIRQLQPQGPYLLGGFSFGGFVAFEMARQLCERGQQVALLALLDVWSPIHRGRLILSEAVAADEAVLVELMAAAARLHGSSPDVDLDEIRAVEPTRRLDWALERLLAAGVLPPAGREHMRRIFKIHLSALSVLRQFVPRVYSGRITILRAPEEDPWLRELVDHPGLGSPELWSGWQALTSEPLVVLDVPGSHSTMMIEPRVRSLASRLTECLNMAEDRT